MRSSLAASTAAKYGKYSNESENRPAPRKGSPRPAAPFAQCYRHEHRRGFLHGHLWGLPYGDRHRSASHRERRVADIGPSTLWADPIGGSGAWGPFGSRARDGLGDPCGGRHGIKPGAVVDPHHQGHRRRRSPIRSALTTVGPIGTSRRALGSYHPACHTVIAQADEGESREAGDISAGYRPP